MGRLSRQDWIDGALEALMQEGHEGLRIAGLARRMGVTTGSFYWHFEGREALRDALLNHWESRLLPEGIQEAKDQGGARALPEVLERRRLPEIDRAFRAWAQADESVAASVARMDDLRIREATGMLEATGLCTEEAQRIARIAALARWGHRDESFASQVEEIREVTDGLMKAGNEPGDG